MHDTLPKTLPVLTLVAMDALVISCLNGRATNTYGLFSGNFGSTRGWRVSTMSRDGYITIHSINDRRVSGDFFLSNVIGSFCCKGCLRDRRL